MFRFDHRRARPVTSELIDLAEQGVIDWETLARDCLGWMSEHDVADLFLAGEIGQRDVG